MEDLRKHIINNNYIFDCPNCFKNIYEYVGKKPIPKDGIINSTDFKPVNKRIPKPRNGQKMFCPLCNG